MGRFQPPLHQHTPCLFVVVEALVVVCCLAASASAKALQGQGLDAWIGGEPSAVNYENAIIALFKSKTGLAFPAFEPTSSLKGVQKFMSKRYLVGASESPLTTVQEKVLKFGKFTVPQVYTTASFSTLLADNIRLSPTQLVRIFRGSITKWREVGVDSDLKIVPIVRGDYNGLQKQMTKYLYLSSRLNKTSPWKWPSWGIGNGPFPRKLWGRNTVIVRNIIDMGKKLRSTPGSIGFLQSGIALIDFKLYEIAVQNRAGIYVTAQGSGNPSAALPRSPPPAGAAWSAVDCTLQPGPQTYPMVFFYYHFYRKSYRGIAAGATLKQWAAFSVSPEAQALFNSYIVYPLPQAYVDKALSVIAQIKV